MLIIDGDYPMAYGGVDLDRDLTLPIDEIRGSSFRHTALNGSPDAETMACLPEMRKGLVRFSHSVSIFFLLKRRPIPISRCY